MIQQNAPGTNGLPSGVHAVPRALRPHELARSARPARPPRGSRCRTWDSALQEALADGLVPVEVRVQHRLQLRQRHAPAVEHLLADDVQGVGQVGQADEGALDPVVARAAVVDVAPARDAVAREHALQRLAAVLAPLLAAARSARPPPPAIAPRQPRAVARPGSRRTCRAAAGGRLRRDLLEQQIPQVLKYGRRHPDVAGARTGVISTQVRVDVVAGLRRRERRAPAAPAGSSRRRRRPAWSSPAPISSTARSISAARRALVPADARPSDRPGASGAAPPGTGTTARW